MKNCFAHLKKILFFLILMLAFGCATSSLIYSTPDDLLAEVELKQTEITSFRIAGTMDHVGKQRIRGDVFLFSNLPSRLRIDVLSPFGTTLSVLTANEERFWLSDYKEGKFYSGESSPCNVARFIGLWLEPEEVVLFLLGKVSLLDGEKKIALGPSGYHEISISQGDLLQKLQYDVKNKDLTLMRALLFRKNTLVYDVTYDSWRRVKEHNLPFEIRIDMPEQDTKLFINYELDSVELNVELPEDAWKQVVPSGVLVEALHCR